MRVLAAAALAPMLVIAAAGPITERAGDALRRDPVYVDEAAADVVSPSEAERLREVIRDGGEPLYVAVLPQAAVEEVGGRPEDVIAALREASGLSGTYAVLAGRSFRAGPSPEAAALATDVFNDRTSDQPFPVLLEFARRATSAGSGGGSGAASDAGRDAGSDGGSDGGGSLLPVLFVVGLGAAALFLFSRSRRRASVDTQALAAAQQDLRAELAVLADDVLRLEPEVVTTPAARPDYDAAVSRYRWLEAAIPAIDSPDDPPRIQRAMDEARYAMARAQAIVRGQPPPPPPPALTTPGPHGEPAVEEDDDDELRRPRYAGQRDRDGGWYGGGFFGGNDLFTGLLLGSMLGGGFGGGFGGGWGGGGHDHGHDQGAGVDVGGGGVDFGGGDFGGGDGGGGDFGGGDFG